MTKRRDRQRFAKSALYRHLPLHRAALILDTFLDTQVTGISENNGLGALQQGMCLRDVGGVASRADKRVNHSGRHIDAHMSLCTHMLIVTLLRLMHLRVASFVSALGRWRRGNQGGIDDRPLTRRRPWSSQMCIDRREYPAGQAMRFQKVLKRAERGGVRCSASGQVGSAPTKSRIA